MRKIKKLVATLLAATMVLAMGVTAFAAENDSTALAAGTYTANQIFTKMQSAPIHQWVMQQLMTCGLTLL